MDKSVVAVESVERAQWEKRLNRLSTWVRSIINTAFPSRVRSCPRKWLWYHTRKRQNANYALCPLEKRATPRSVTHSYNFPCERRRKNAESEVVSLRQKVMINAFVLACPLHYPHHVFIQHGTWAEEIRCHSSSLIFSSSFNDIVRASSPLIRIPYIIFARIWIK